MGIIDSQINQLFRELSTNKVYSFDPDSKTLKISFVATEKGRSLRAWRISDSSQRIILWLKQLFAVSNPDWARMWDSAHIQERTESRIVIVLDNIPSYHVITNQLYEWFGFTRTITNDTSIQTQLTAPTTSLESIDNTTKATTTTASTADSIVTTTTSNSLVVVDDIDEIMEEKEDDDDDDEEDEEHDNHPEDSHLWISFERLASSLLFDQYDDFEKIKKQALQPFTKRMMDRYLIPCCLQMGSRVRTDLYNNVQSRGAQKWRMKPWKDSAKSICDGCLTTRTLQKSFEYSGIQRHTLSFGSECASKFQLIIRYVKWQEELLDLINGPIPLQSYIKQQTIRMVIQSHFQQLKAITDDMDSIKGLE